MKTTGKLLAICGLLAGIYGTSNGQYYGGGYGRGGQSNNQPQNNDAGISEPSGYLSFNLGLAQPVSSYGLEFGSGYGGYALAGLGFNLALGIPIDHSNFGIALMYGNYNNTYDINTYVNNQNTENPGSYFTPISPSDNVYSLSSIMGGLFVTYPVGRFSFDGRLMVGALLCDLPEQDFAYNDAQNNTWEDDLQPSNSTGLAFDAGLGARCLLVKLGRRPLCAMVNVDYLYSDPYYSTSQNIYETYAAGTNAGNTVQWVPSPVYSGHLPISMLNLTFGIGYQIGK
jgi:hypothetical protein